MTALVLLLPASLTAQDSRPAKQGGETRKDEAERKPVAFSKAVEAFVQTLRTDAPTGIKVEVEDTTPKKLGWAAPGKTPARALTVWHPNGTHRALGLLPREGTYTPLEGAWPQVVALGPHLVVVAAPGQEVALTREAIDRAIPLLQKTLSSLDAWTKGAPLKGDARPAPLRGAKTVVRHAHYFEVDLAEGQTLDEKALAGLGAVVWRHVVQGKPPTPPTIAIVGP